MSTSIPANILGISGQVVNTITQQDTGEIVVSCKRDKRTMVIDPVSKLKTSVNLYTHRTIKDLPLLGHPCFVEIELAQVNTHDGYRIIEDNSFVDLGCRHSKRLCRLINKETFLIDLGFSKEAIDFTLADYIDLVDASGRTIRTNKRGYIDENLPPILSRIGLDATTWIDELNQFKFNGRKALGTIKKLKKYVEHIKAKMKMNISLRPALE